MSGILLEVPLMRPEMREILASVSKPFRYIGGEKGSFEREWESADVRVCLAFPEIYEIGMSHLGLSILYHIINEEPGMLAERAFAPWHDMEHELRVRGMSLFTLESHRALAEFDIVGISLAYELTYTNALNILSLSGIPLRAVDRDEGDPLVIAGGPCAFNPEPVAPFFDAFVIGDGEDAAIDIARAVRNAKCKRLSRSELVDSLHAIEGVYVPSADNGPARIRMARIAHLDETSFPKAPILAYAATHQRVAVEVARGCARGCRFCQAGFTYRPVRQRSEETAVDLACEGLASTGHDDFSFLSLSIGDWAPLESALSRMHAGLSTMPVNAALPSVRAEAISDGIADALGNARSGSFTLAPEAGTERMRRFINKGNSDADLYASAEKIFSKGWRAIKLYFMLGLPGETDEDMAGILRTARRCLDIGRRHHRRPSVTVSTSTFVPKPHTPFQWERQISIEEILARQKQLKKLLRGPGLFYSWHGAEVSYLEGVLSRGGRELASVIEAAFRRGARFDGWDESFDLNVWRKAFSETGIDADRYLEQRAPEELFPWDRLGIGPSREFLWLEKKRARDLILTEDCTRGPCVGCGICDRERGIVNRIAESKPATQATPATRERPATPAPRFRYRVRFIKQGRAAFLGQVETLDVLRRGFRASGLELIFTEGFRPRARISSGPALPVGMESLAEHADVELAFSLGPVEIVKKLQGRLSCGMAVEEVWSLDERAPSIDDSIESILYEIDIPSLNGAELRGLELIGSGRAIIYNRIREGKCQNVDIRDIVSELALQKQGVLRMAVLNRKPALKIIEIIQGVFGISEGDARKVQVRKVGVKWK